MVRPKNKAKNKKKVINNKNNTTVPSEKKIKINVVHIKRLYVILKFRF